MVSEGKSWDMVLLCNFQGIDSFTQFHAFKPSFRAAIARTLSAVINIGEDSPTNLLKYPFFSV